MHSERNLDSGEIEEARQRGGGGGEGEYRVLVPSFCSDGAEAKWNVKGRLFPALMQDFKWLLISMKFNLGEFYLIFHNQLYYLIPVKWKVLILLIFNKKILKYN